MVKERDFNSVFDFRSAFDYGPADIDMNSYRRNNYKSAFSYHAISLAPDEEIENCAKETMPIIILRSTITCALYILSILLFPVSCWICIKRVHALERIVSMRLGRLQPIKGPGFAFILPFADQWTRVDLRPQNFTVATTQLLTADGGVVEAQTDIEYRVSDVISYVLKLHQQESTLRDLGLFCLTNIVSEKDQEDLEFKKELVSCSLKDELNRSAVNWGLEVVDVYLHSVKILKAAEPVDAIGTIMTALKAATGQSSEHTAAVFPYIPKKAESSTVVEDNRNLTSSASDSPHQDADCLDRIKRLVNLAEQEGYLKDLTATFKFDIVGRSTRTVFISVEKGNVSILETLDSSMNSDVQLMLTEDNLTDFLSGEVSPLEAYMEGKVMVTGDWSLLRSLAKVFSLCKKI